METWALWSYCVRTVSVHLPIEAHGEHSSLCLWNRTGGYQDIKTGMLLLFVFLFFFPKHGTTYCGIQFRLSLLIQQYVFYFLTIWYFIVFNDYFKSISDIMEHAVGTHLLLIKIFLIAGRIVERLFYSGWGYNWRALCSEIWKIF